MPELPEVETMARDLRKKIIGLTVTSTEVFDPRVIAGFDADGFVREMQGVTFEEVERRGKGIIITLSGGRYLFVQVKMTGFFCLRSAFAGKRGFQRDQSHLPAFQRRLFKL